MRYVTYVRIYFRNNIISPSPVGGPIERKKTHALQNRLPADRPHARVDADTEGLTATINCFNYNGVTSYNTISRFVAQEYRLFNQKQIGLKTWEKYFSNVFGTNIRLREKTLYSK